MTFTRSRTDAAGVEHVEEIELVSARAVDGTIHLTIAPEATRDDVATLAYGLGYEAGARAASDLCMQAIEPAAAALARGALRELAAGGSVAAALLLPKTKTIVRDGKGAIVGITESIG
jgi:hypothetical protein